MSKSLFENIIMEEDRADFLDNLSILERQLFDVKTSPLHKIKNVLGKNGYEVFDFEAKKEKINISDPVEVGEFVRRLKRNLVSFPTATISVAFFPTREFVSQVSFWIERNFNKKIILKIVVDVNVAGGAQISYNGLYKDYSLRSLIDGFVEKRGGNIL